MLPRRERFRKLIKHLRNLATRDQQSPYAVFVFGDMRSGTNMLKECFYRTARTAVFNESDEDAFDDFMLRDLVVIDRLVERSPARVVVFKALADSARSVELLDRYADSRGIWIYRRYQDVINSAVRTVHWRSPIENLRMTLEEPERARWRRLNLSESQLDLMRHHYARGLDDNSARALIWYVRNDLFFSQQLDRDPRVVLINYERLVETPDQVLRRAWEHVGLPHDHRHHAHVSPRSVGRHTEPVIDAEISRLADDMMRRLEAVRARQEREFSLGRDANDPGHPAPPHSRHTS